MSEERIQKILARAGLGSRRSCEELIEQGRVLVNGKKAVIGQKADISVDKILVDGNLIPQIKSFRYVAFYKPRFVLCDKVEGDHRRTVFDLVDGGQELDIVGRLDYESEGLVLLTNDGDLLNKLTHPRYQHEKEYRVLVSTHPDEKQLEIWRRGIVLEDGHRTSPAQVTLERTSGKGAWIRIVLKEGHKRQIREMAKLTGLFVVKLVRIRIGSLTLGSMKPGEFRNLSEDEVKRLKSLQDQQKSPIKRIVKKKGG